ncbi:MAG: hypothetical protein ACJAVG_000192 [Rickettsiales bacterium]|jgi:hypothetical protein
MFHEIGHSIFGWLFGYINLPSITTIFNHDKHAGLTFTFGHSLIIQIFALFALFYGCFFIYQNRREYFYPALFVAIAIAAISFTKYHNILTDYMGHGTAMLMGGFFLFRSLVYLDARNGFELWLNGFFGFFFILKNIHFSYLLIYDPLEKMRYVNAVAVTHDFVQLTRLINSWTIDGIAMTTIALGIIIIISSFSLAGRYGRS